jgi:23S rRNA U2552 (ribose-2'-O)-methylase RlmE/FtsJ
MLSQVKYFLGDIDDRGVYVDYLKFQGSSDNTEWIDLFTVDDNIHEGWNYYTWEEVEEYPKYRYYRFYSSHSGAGCDLHEMKMTGVETVDHSESTYTCEATVEMRNVTLETLEN